MCVCVCARARVVALFFTCLHRWEKEVQRHCKPGSLSVFVHHYSRGVTDNDDIRYIAAKYDIVVCTYNAVSRRSKKGAELEEAEANDWDTTIPTQFEDVVWWRIVVDEAHHMRTPATRLFQSAICLRAVHRLCITGTPVHNRPEDAASLLRFFGVEARDAKAHLDLLLNECMVRARKADRRGDGSHMERIPKREEIAEVHPFASQAEADFYNSIKQATRVQWQLYTRKGTLLSAQMNILEMLLRLRQAATHPELVVKSLHAKGRLDDVDPTAVQKSKSAPPGVTPKRACHCEDPRDHDADCCEPPTQDGFVGDLRLSTLSRSAAVSDNAPVGMPAAPSDPVASVEADALDDDLEQEPQLDEPHLWGLRGPRYRTAAQFRAVTGRPFFPSTRLLNVVAALKDVLRKDEKAVVFSLCASLRGAFREGGGLRTSVCLTLRRVASFVGDRDKLFGPH